MWSLWMCGLRGHWAAQGLCFLCKQEPTKFQQVSPCLPHGEIDDKSHYFSPWCNSSQSQMHFLKTLIYFSSKAYDMVDVSVISLKSAVSTEENHRGKLWLFFKSSNRENIFKIKIHYFTIRFSKSKDDPLHSIILSNLCIMPLQNHTQKNKSTVSKFKR